MSSSIGFTFGEIGSVRDRQTATMDRQTDRISGALDPASDESAEPPHVGEYLIDDAPLAPDDLVDAEVDAELEALLAASTVVRRNEGP